MGKMRRAAVKNIMHRKREPMSGLVLVTRLGGPMRGGLTTGCAVNDQPPYASNTHQIRELSRTLRLIFLKDLSAKLRCRADNIELLIFKIITFI